MIALFLVDVRQRLSVEYVAIVVRLAADEVIQLLSLEHDGPPVVWVWQAVMTG